MESYQNKIFQRFRQLTLSHLYKSIYSIENERLDMTH